MGNLALFIFTILLYMGLAVFLVWYLVSRDRGQKEPPVALWVAAMYGLLAVVLAYFINSLSLGQADIAANLSAVPALDTWFYAMRIGFTEEILKFLPLAVYLYGREYFNEHTDGVIYFAIVGLAFGLLEDILYLVQSGDNSIIRVIFGGFFHAATTALVGFYLARKKIQSKSIWLPILALIAASLIHALYDFLLFRGGIVLVVAALVIVVLVNVGLFITYQLAKEFDQSIGLSN